MGGGDLVGAEEDVARFSGRLRMAPLMTLRSTLPSCSHHVRNELSTAMARLAMTGAVCAMLACQCSTALRLMARGSDLPNTGTT